MDDLNTINAGAFLTFVLVTTFTPGPNNISSSSMGVLVGYPRTLRYILGIVTGFFVIMLLSGAISRTVYDLAPGLESAMRIVGAGYILWLAYKTLSASYQFEGEGQSAEGPPVLAYRDGLLLQALNPKVWVYALTLYATFLSGITGNVPLLILSAAFLASMSFASTSSWAIGGALIKNVLRQPRYQRAINVGLALLLAYTAVELSGLLH